VLAVTAIIVDYTFEMCFQLKIFYRRPPKCHGIRGNLPRYSPSRWAWVH